MIHAIKNVCVAASLALSIFSWNAGRGIPTVAQKAKHQLDAVGEPKELKAGQTERYAVWHDDKGWHLRTTTAGKEHQFKGRVLVDGGTISGAYSAHLEKEGRLEDHWKVGAEKHEVAFDFKTDKGMDGIDFQVSKDSKDVKFELLIDGKEHPDRVFVGHEGHHPEHMPFSLPAHPHHAKKK